MKNIVRWLYEAIYKKPYDTEGFIDLKQIVIPEDYLATTPHADKVKRMYTYYFRHQRLDEPITVRTDKNTHKTILVNGYIRSLISWDIARTYMNTYNCKYEELPEKFCYVPIKWVKE